MFIMSPLIEVISHSAGTWVRSTSNAVRLPANADAARTRGTNTARKYILEFKQATKDGGGLWSVNDCRRGKEDC